MRSAGTLVDFQHLGDHDHCCWVFDRPTDFLERSFDSLMAGIKDGLRGIYVSTDSGPALEREIRGFEGTDRLLDDGSLQVWALEETYDAPDAVDPVRQVAAYSKATNDALADGFRGLRVAANATDQIQTPEQLNAFARYEHLIDRYMADHPFSAICGYRLGGAVDSEVAAQIASLHPLTVTQTAPFQFFAEAGGIFSLSGEIDFSTSALLEWTLERAEPARPPSEVMVDVSALRFIDHHGLYALARYAGQRDTRIVLVHASGIVRRITEILGIPGLAFSEER